MKFTLPQRARDRGLHKWFAWFPVLCDDGSYRWLERVWRSRVVRARRWPEGWVWAWSYYAWEQIA